jgi:hypothetical protein
LTEMLLEAMGNLGCHYIDDVFLLRSGDIVDVGDKTSFEFFQEISQTSFQP